MENFTNAKSLFHSKLLDEILTAEVNESNSSADIVLFFKC